MRIFTSKGVVAICSLLCLPLANCNNSKSKKGSSDSDSATECQNRQQSQTFLSAQQNDGSSDYQENELALTGVNTVQQIISQTCAASCHNSNSTASQRNLLTLQDIQREQMNIYSKISIPVGQAGVMPPVNAPVQLSAEDKQTLLLWQQNGFPDPSSYTGSAQNGYDPYSSQTAQNPYGSQYSNSSNANYNDPCYNNGASSGYSQGQGTQQQQQQQGQYNNSGVYQQQGQNPNDPYQQQSGTVY